MKIKKFFSILLCVLFLISPVQAFASAYVSDSQIVSAKTPSEASETELAWSVRFGNSYKDAPSNQTVVGDTLLVMSNKKLLKLDVETGKTLKSADMVDMAEQAGQEANAINPNEEPEAKEEDEEAAEDES